MRRPDPTALSGGRFVFGVGADWVAAESAALEEPVAERGVMTDEYRLALQEPWTTREPRFDSAPAPRETTGSAHLDLRTAISS